MDRLQAERRRHGPRFTRQEPHSQRGGHRLPSQATTAHRCGLRAGRRPEARAAAPSSCSRGAASSSRNISRSSRICAGAALPWPSTTGADRAARIACWRTATRDTSAISPSIDRDITRFMKEVVLPDCPPPYIALAHSMGGNILLRNAVVPGSWFERMILSAPMLALSAEKVPDPARPGPLLRRAHERLRRRHLVCARRICHTRRGRPVRGQRAHLRRGALRAQSAGGGGRACARPRLTDDRLAARGLSLEPDADAPGFRRTGPRAAASSRPLGADSIVSSLAIEEFSSRLRMGAHVVIASSRHEILQERDEIRARFWAAFDAYLGVSAAAA